MTNPKDIRLLVSDVDGTLVTKDKVLTDAAKAAASALREAGIALALTSSRPAQGMRMLIEPLQLVTPLAGCNGGLLVDTDLKVIETHAIEAQTARRVVGQMQADGLDVWVYTETDWLVKNADARHVAREAWILKFDPKVVDTFTDDHLKTAIKIVGVSDDHDRLAASERKAQSEFGDTVSAARSAAYFLDVTDPFANKGQVVHTLAKRLNIAPDQIATIGDMQNDVLMFRQGGFSIAMGNADDEVKAAANAVTDSNEDDGWAKAVRRFLLKENGA
jgi:Cof subfamily protein (haloacid dehalogenase superfamily)